MQGDKRGGKVLTIGMTTHALKGDKMQICTFV